MKVVLLFVFLFPTFSNALNCKSRKSVTKAIEKTDFGMLNLHVFRSKNLSENKVTKDNLRCGWETVNFNEYTRYETYPAFQAQYICRDYNEFTWSPYIQFTGYCADNQVKLLHINFDYDEGQFP